MEQTLQTTSVPLDLPNHKQAWEMVLATLRNELSRGDYETWVRPMRSLGYQNRVFTLGVLNPYGRDWFESRLQTRVLDLLDDLFGERVSLRVMVLDGFVTAPEAAPEPEPAPAGKPGRPAAAPSPRKVMLQRAYGSERARLIQPERGMFLTQYLFNNWLPLLGHSAFTVVLAARSLCYWNPMTGELRNTIETDMSELAARASVSVRTVKDVLAGDLVRRYFLRYVVRRIMTPNGVRTAGISLQVRMDDPLTPEDQAAHNLPEEERWYTAEFEDERED